MFLKVRASVLPPPLLREETTQERFNLGERKRTINGNVGRKRRERHVVKKIDSSSEQLVKHLRGRGV